MGHKTSLHGIHKNTGAKIVDFGGWDMPLHYGSQIDEHHVVRKDAGIFDVSHMTIVDLQGGGVRKFLDHLLANDIGKLRKPGKALYSCMLNESGGVIDDLITYYFDEQNFRLVVNASTREQDLAWITKQAEFFDISISERDQLAMLAIQGPNARERVAGILSDELSSEAMNLSPFCSASVEDWLVARTGYTGEDGFEVCLPCGDAATFWESCVEAGVSPCGLGARDTLRLEAGMNLYGNDMDDSTSPLESGLSWTVALKDQSGQPRGFVGAQALREQKTNGITRKLVGAILRGKGVMRAGQQVFSGDRLLGELSSGSFSPTLGCAIGFVRLVVDAPSSCEVEIRNRRLPVELVKLPFVRRGQIMIELN